MMSPLLNPGSAYSILIVCTGNICRSPMAEGLMKSMWPKALGRQSLIHSAGTHATQGLPAEPNAVRVLDERGVDIRKHRSRALDSTLTINADLILTMEGHHTDFIKNYVKDEPVNVRLLCGFDATEECGEVPDPYGESLHTYRECANMIQECIGRIITFLSGNSVIIRKPGSPT